MYVGDARGRVFSWSVAEQPGRAMADHWLKDEGAESCVGCGVRFSLYERRHHCRNCGLLFCSRLVHTRNSYPLNLAKFFKKCSLIFSSQYLLIFNKYRIKKNVQVTSQFCCI
jgi:hypothetical protein